MRAVSNSFAANSSRSCISVSIGSFGEGSVAITRLPGIGQFVIVAEDSISFRSCSRINDGKQMLAYSLASSRYTLPPITRSRTTGRSSSNSKISIVYGSLSVILLVCADHGSDQSGFATGEAMSNALQHPATCQLSGFISRTGRCRAAFRVRALSSASNAMCSKEFAPGASDILKQALV